MLQLVENCSQSIAVHFLVKIINGAPSWILRVLSFLLILIYPSLDMCFHVKMYLINLSLLNYQGVAIACQSRALPRQQSSLLNYQGVPRSFMVLLLAYCAFLVSCQYWSSGFYNEGLISPRGFYNHSINLYFPTIFFIIFMKKTHYQMKNTLKATPKKI